MEELINIIKTNQTINKMLNNCPYYILSQMKIIHQKAKKFYLNQGTSHSNVYIIVSGKVKIFVSDENGRQILLDIYKEGNFIGEQEVFLNEPYSASIENITDCLLIQIPNQAFIQWVKHDSHFNQALIYSLCEQMYELTNRAAKYSLSTVKEQVLDTLFDLNKTNTVIDKKLLLESVSATPRSVYRVLNELEQMELIKVDSRVVSIIDESKLYLERKKI